MGKYMPVIQTAASGSLAKAAQKLGCSKPNLSYLIAAVEEELGVKLFHRNQRGMIPTGESQPLLAIMEQIEKLETELLEQSQTWAHGDLRVGILPGLASQWLPGILTGFCRERPQVGVKLEYIQDPEEGKRRVKEGTLDLLFSSGCPTEDLCGFPLWKEPYSLLVSGASPLSRLGSITLAEVEQAVTLVPGSEFRKEQEVDSRKRERQSPVAVLPDGDRLPVTLVESGLGAAVVPWLTALELLVGRNIRAVPIRDVPARQLWLFCDRERGELPEAFVEQTLDFVSAWCTDLTLLREA